MVKNNISLSGCSMLIERILVAIAYTEDIFRHELKDLAFNVISH